MDSKAVRSKIMIDFPPLTLTAVKDPHCNTVIAKTSSTHASDMTRLA